MTKTYKDFSNYNHPTLGIAKSAEWGSKYFIVEGKREMVGVSKKGQYVSEERLTNITIIDPSEQPTGLKEAKERLNEMLSEWREEQVLASMSEETKQQIAQAHEEYQRLFGHKEEPVQQQEEIQHEALAVEEVQELTVENRQEQAENYIIEMDMVEAELQQATTYELFAGCKRSLEMLKSEIVALGYEVKRVPTGWMLVEPVGDVAQVASQPEVELKEDAEGLYAQVPSRNGKGAYTVRVCARWLYTVSCDCPARGDCRHRVQVDRAFDGVRPTFSEQVKGVTTSREVIARLVTPDRYAQPLRGSGVTGFKATEIAQKLAA